MTHDVEALARQAAETTVGPVDSFERAVVDQLFEGVDCVDRARRIRYWNPGAERQPGFSAGDVVGHFCYDDLLTTSTRPDVVDRLRWEVPG